MNNGWKIISLFLLLSVLTSNSSKKDKILKKLSILHQRRDKKLNSKSVYLKFASKSEWEWWLIGTERWPINSPRQILWGLINNTKNYLENSTPLPLTSNSLALVSKTWKIKLFLSIWGKKTPIESTVLIRSRIWKIIFVKFTPEKLDTNICMFTASSREISSRLQFKSIYRL